MSFSQISTKPKPTPVRSAKIDPAPDVGTSRQPSSIIGRLPAFKPPRPLSVLPAVRYFTPARLANVLEIDELLGNEDKSVRLGAIEELRETIPYLYPDDRLVLADRIEGRLVDEDKGVPDEDLSWELWDLVTDLRSGRLPVPVPRLVPIIP